MEENKDLQTQADETSESRSFEQSMARLEQIVRQLEDGNVPLDDLMKLYDEGTALVRSCTERINQAEQKIRTVQLKNGTVTEEDFQTP